jgi:hypothetical protein
MTTIELWNLIFSGLTAIGTVGAVIISLWLARPHWKRFTVKYIHVSCMTTIKNSEHSQEGALFLMIHNHQNVPMEIQYIALRFRYKENNRVSEQQWKCEKEFIPPLSQYEVKADLKQGWAVGAVAKADEITVSLKTSLGDQTVPFPEKYLMALIKSLEVNPHIDQGAV